MGYFLFGACVVAFAIFLAITSKYEIPPEWETALYTALMFVSILVVALRGPLWKLWSFWVSLIPGVVVQVWVVRALHPEKMRRTKPVVAIGFFFGLLVWALVFGGIRYLARQFESNGGELPPAR